jgi:hypothetical protein
MKMTKEDLKDFVEMIEEAETFRPIIKLFIDALKSYSGEIREIPEMVRKWHVEQRIATIRQYEDAGFSSDAAITMTLDDIAAIKRLANKIEFKK